MLVPAQLYEKELDCKMISCWYDPKYAYYFSGEHRRLTIPDNAEYRRNFACIDSKGEIVGYFCYDFDNACRSIYNMGLIGFTDNSALLVRDVIREITRVFQQESAQRMEFWAFTDNPAVRLYDKFIRRFGGRKVATLHRTAYFMGKYHDMVVYEILWEATAHA